jgi:tetratricopeptide (TPR) repeat protein
VKLTPASKAFLSALATADEKDQIGYTRYLCERFLAHHPDHVPTLIRYANNLISLAQYDAAEAALDHAQSKVSAKRLHLVLAQRGHLFEAKGDFLNAKRLFMEAHQLDPADATYLIYAASASFRAGDIDRAQKLASKAADCKEGCVDEAWFNLGGYLLSDKRYHDAADCYRKALEIDPNYEIAKERLEDVELIIARVG